MVLGIMGIRYRAGYPGDLNHDHRLLEAAKGAPKPIVRRHHTNTKYDIISVFIVFRQSDCSALL